MAAARWDTLYCLAVVGSHFWLSSLFSGMHCTVWPLLSLTSGLAGVSDWVLPLIWPFKYSSLILCVSPYLYSWGWPYGADFLRLSHRLALVGTVLLHLVWPLSALTSGSAMVSTRVMPLVWPFCAESLFLRVSQISLYLGLAVRWCRLTACLMTWFIGDRVSSSCVAAIGSSLWFGRGFGAHNASCLDVTCQIPIIARQPLPICLGFALCCCCPPVCLITCLSGDGASTSCAVVVVSHFWFGHSFGSRDTSCWLFCAGYLFLHVRHISLCLGMDVCCFWLMDCSITWIGEDGVIARAFYLGCVFPIIFSALWLCFLQTLLMLLPLALDIVDRVVVVRLGVRIAVTGTFP